MMRDPTPLMFLALAVMGGVSQRSMRSALESRRNQYRPAFCGTACRASSAGVDAGATKRLERIILLAMQLADAIPPMIPAARHDADRWTRYPWGLHQHPSSSVSTRPVSRFRTGRPSPSVTTVPTNIIALMR